MKNTSLRKDYAWNTIGIFAQNAISPLLLIAITRINGIQDSGLFSFAFSVAIIFWTLGMWGGRTYQVSDIRQEFAHKSYIAVRFILAVVMLIGVIAFGLINHYDLFKISVMVALVLFKVFESIADALYGILQVNHRLYMVGRSLLYKAILGFVAFILIDIATHNIFYASTGIVVANILIILGYDIPRMRRVEHDIDSEKGPTYHIRQAFVIMKRCLPVFAVAFLVVFSLNIPRYFIDRFHTGEIGYFGILAMPITLIGLLMTFVLQPNVVGMTRLYHEGKNQQFNGIVVRLCIIIAAAGLGVLIVSALIGVQLLQVIFGVDFHAYYAALVVMVAGGIINAFVSIFVNILTIMRHFKGQFYTLVFTNIALAVASLFVVNQFGLLGGVSLFAAINSIQLIFLLLVYVRLIRNS